MDYQLPIEGIVDRNILQKLLSAENDSLLIYSFYQDLLDHVLHNYYSPKTKLIKEKNGSHWDFRQVYDTIQNSSLVSEKAKKILLFKTFSKLVETSSIDDIQQYLNKFKQDVQDSAYLHYLTLRYGLEKEVSQALIVKGLSGQTASFGNIVTQNQGNLIYIDFWASWCAPCIKAMPASQELHQMYADKGVAFLYLSMDEDANKWQKAAKKHGIDGELNSYLINNRYTSKMLEDLEVQSIPRYLLYDRQSKLVHKNAPGPDSKEIKKLLDQYLARVSAPK